MAIAKSGLLRGLKGKTSGLVMAQTKQGTVVREYKDTITNPRTPAQQSNRAVFKAAVERSSATKDLVFKMYGTNRMPSYSKLVSMIMKNIGGKATRSFKNGILTPVPSMLNQIGVNNEEANLGNLDLSNAKIYFTDNGNRVEFFLHSSALSFKEEDTNVYFGCDYAIDDVNLLFVGLNGMVNKNIPLTFARIGGEQNGVKNLGYFKTAEECGLGWNYIYSFKAYRNSDAEEGQQFQHTLHYTFYDLIGDVESTFYKPAIYEANDVNGLGDYWYATVLIWSSQGEATRSKKGSLLLSAGNFYFKIRPRT